MLPELIYREEQQDNYLLLFLLGLASGLIGYMAASVVFPSQVSILAVVFASLPLIYPLTRTFLEDERNDRPHVDEVFMYGSLFIGEALAFMLLVTVIAPENLSVQIAQFAPEIQAMGINTLSGTGLEAVVTGSATSSSGFISIFLHNTVVFSLILGISALISSSGAMVLTWNASVLGTFFGILVSRLSGFELLTGSSKVITPLAYIPHATFEMAGFIIAGIAGSLISAAVYREHFDKETWIDYIKLVGLGIAFVFIAAMLETA